MEFHDPVSVYTLANPVEAAILKNFLEAEGIRCFLDGLHQAGLEGLGALEIKVMVPAGEADRARKLIRTNETHRKKP
jgi:hypothetical protein